MELLDLNLVGMHSTAPFATFNGNLCTTIFSSNRSTSVSDETDLITFYNELSAFVRSIPKHSVLILGGNIYVQIGKNENNKFC